MIEEELEDAGGALSARDRQTRHETWSVISGSDSEMRHANRVWSGGFALVAAIHLAWAAANRMPPIWDMAHHQFMGWLHLQAFEKGTLLADLSSISSYYPPLYYIQEAFVLSLTGPTRFLAWIINLPGLLLLSFSTYRIALRICRPVPAALAGITVLLLPLVAWSSRETLLDPTLTGWVALALLLILKSNLLESRGWTLVLGLGIAAGMLTKWTFIVFLIPPLLFSLYSTRTTLKAVRNLFDAGLVALPWIFWWYLPNLGSLWQRFELTAQAASWEQDPLLSSVWGWIYYPRSLSSYYLFFLLTVAFGWALYLLCRHRLRGTETFLLWTLLGGILILTLLKAKDPRYVMPLVSALWILLIGTFASQKGQQWVLVIVVIGFIQFLAISFTIPFFSGKCAFFELKEDPDYLGMGREWVLYSSDYFGVLGPPRVEDWHHAEIAKHFEDAARVGFVPDAARFNPATLRLSAMELGIRPEIERVGHKAGFQEQLEGLEWVVGKTGDQGISYITQYNEQVYDAVEARNWRLIEKWRLPDGTEAVLWQNPTPSQ